MKVAKLARVMRTVAIFRRLEAEMKTGMAKAIHLTKICLLVAFLAHLSACGFAYMARAGGVDEFYTDSWMAAEGLVDAPFPVQ